MQIGLSFSREVHYEIRRYKDMLEVSCTSSKCLPGRLRLCGVKGHRQVDMHPSLLGSRTAIGHSLISHLTSII